MTRGKLRTCEIERLRRAAACEVVFAGDEPGHDRRTFECPGCPNVTVRIVKYRATVPTRPLAEVQMRQPASLEFFDDVSGGGHGTISTIIRPPDSDQPQTCPRCGTRMRLIWIADKEHHDRHAFECPACEIEVEIELDGDT
jgi:transcription elongation factor Elf1